MSYMSGSIGAHEVPMDLTGIGQHEGHRDKLIVTEEGQVTTQLRAFLIEIPRKIRGKQYPHFCRLE
jgi:hypothetical protein